VCPRENLIVGGVERGRASKEWRVTKVLVRKIGSTEESAM